MFFELSIARKYLTPKKKQIAVSLIALMSVAVISLVVWLVLLFLSITEGMEKNWLHRLTSLSAPIRIHPTQKYFSSYYYLIDQFSSQSGYATKTIGQKAFALKSDPYDPDLDSELPLSLPPPEFEENGSLKDPVKRVYQVLSHLKEHKVFTQFQEYEMSGALLRLQLLRLDSHLTTESQNFLTQVSYLASFPSRSPTLAELILPPNMEDLNHLFYLGARHLSDVTQDIPSSFLENSQNIQEQLEPLLKNIEIKELKTALAISPKQFQEKLLSGEVSCKGLEISKADIKTRFSLPPLIPPPWAFSQQNMDGALWNLPKNSEGQWGILLAKNFQDNGVHIGDRGYLSYSAPTVSALVEQRLPVYVAGFYDPGIMTIGNKCIFVSEQVTRMINASSSFYNLDKASANGIQVWFSDLQEAEKIKTTIKKAFEEAGIDSYWNVSTFREYDFAKDLLQQFESDKYLFTLIGVIILAVAACNILSFLVLLVSDKRKEIGILQSMGASKKSIALIFGICGAFVGTLSSFLGIGLALLTLHNIDLIVKALSFLQGHDAFNALFFGKSLPDELSPKAFYFILIATPLLSIIAGLIPALKACRLNPSQILRSE